MHYQGRVIVSIPGKGPELTPDIKAVIQHPMTLGVVLFDSNFENKQQLLQLIANIQKAGEEASKKDVPIFTDQEGGNVQRLRRGGFRPIPSAKAIGDVYRLNRETGLQYAHQYGQLLAKELMSVGVIPFGPVVDLDQGNSAISGNDRSFHEDPKALTEIANAYIRGMTDIGIPATAKHWPGHGKAIGDSHHEVIGDQRPLEEIPDIEVVYKTLSPNLKAVMLAHITYPKVDKLPVVSSDIWMSILRDTVGFKGVTISDCLTMKGAGKESNVSKMTETLKRLDVALLCHLPPLDYLPILEALADLPILKGTQERISEWVESTAMRRAEIKREHSAPISQASMFA